MNLLIPSTYLGVRTADETLRDLLTTAGVSEDVTGGCELALHELLTNLVDHAYNGAEDQIITILLSLEHGKLVMQTIDNGSPASVQMDDISMPDPDELAEGGYGLALIQMLIDSVSYQSTQGQNTWTLVKNIS
jgi:serine/threonine-protein kinase RsbW